MGKHQRQMEIANRMINPRMRIKDENPIDFDDKHGEQRIGKSMKDIAKKYAAGFFVSCCQPETQ